MKTCTKCGETKEFNAFTKRKEAKDGYRGVCKSCRNVQTREWELRNPEKRSEQRKKWRDQHLDEARKATAAWHLKNPHSRTEYKKKNPGVYANASVRRERKKAHSIPKHLVNCKKEKDAINKIYIMRALISQVTGVQHHVDHMWPLADGGPHWSGNLQIITAEENVKKRAKVDPAIKATIQEMLAEEVRLNAER
jgi:hypothetical protein